MPWVYARREIARRWGVPPPVVDEYPAAEVILEARLMAIEAECAPVAARFPVQR